ncbi:MAG: hypothetical protein ACLFTE_10420, partial [Salinivenus sp.]
MSTDRSRNADIASPSSEFQSTAEGQPLEQQTVAQQTINAIRFLSADAVERAGSGHPGTPMALAP